MLRQSRRAIRALAIIAAFTPLGQAFAAQDIEKLQTTFTRAYQAGNWKKAIETGHKLVEASPDGGLHQYNLACCYALSGDKARALEWLEKAADSGFADDELMARDADFESIRDDEAFKKQLARVKETAQKRKLKAGEAVVEIIVPENLDRTKPAPAILALHGQGGRAKDMIEVWRNVAADAGAILIAPQATQKLGGGRDWRILLDAEFSVLSALEKAEELHKIDAKRIVLTGFSQGGMVSYSLGLKQPKRFRGVIMVAAGYDDRLVPPPVRSKEGSPRFFIMEGSKDPNLEANRLAAKGLQAAGIECEFHVYDGIGHAFPKDRDAELRKALRYVLE